MVSVSVETPSQTVGRLALVLRAATVDVLPGLWSFRELDGPLPLGLLADPLAAVRDDDSWSLLAPARSAGDEAFRLFRVHFAEGMDNGGFVGWLASELKRAVGTGVFVVCGQNSARGGIFDYWGAPAAVAAEVLGVLADLRGERHLD
jgi:hypothetical protein